jgi:hypothetical protein
VPQLWRLLPYAPLSAQEVARARSAFDEVWAQIADNYVGENATEEARIRLATIVLALTNGKPRRSAQQLRWLVIALMRRAH